MATDGKLSAPTGTVIRVDFAKGRRATERADTSKYTCKDCIHHGRGCEWHCVGFRLDPEHPDYQKGQSK